MKKAICILIFVMIFAGSAFAAGHKLGIISHVNTTEAEYYALNNKHRANSSVRFFSCLHTADELPSFVFYDSFITMLLALDAGDVDEIVIPEAVAEYLIKTSGGKYFETCVVRSMPVSYSFGFRKSDGAELKTKFDEALLSMKADGSLYTLVGKYIYDAGAREPEAVNFEKFEDAHTIKVAVTGDLPPIDYIAPDGKPAGFNTAVLAEIAKRLKFNVELVNIEAGARSASLASGRSDVVFWFKVYETDLGKPDIPEEVILSEPYFKFSEFLHVAVKK